MTPLSRLPLGAALALTLALTPLVGAAGRAGNVRAWICAVRLAGRCA